MSILNGIGFHFCIWHCTTVRKQISNKILSQLDSLPNDELTIEKIPTLNKYFWIILKSFKNFLLVTIYKGEERRKEERDFMYGAIIITVY